MSKITKLIQDSISSRQKLLKELEKEKTNAYRLFHGVNDNWEGLSIDRYGESILIQTFREALKKEEFEEIKEALFNHFISQENSLKKQTEQFFIYNHRGINKENKLDFETISNEKAVEKKVFHELGLNYIFQGRHRGQDPFLFLDMRAGRRFLIKNSKGLSFLNLFSYTNGSGLCAMSGGAKEVLNIDFSESSLAIGNENAKLNNFIQPNFKTIKMDVFSALRQFSNIPFKGRNRNKVKEDRTLKEQKFDLVFLDPPAWSKSPHGTIDLIRDYQSIFKLCLLCTEQGGRIVAVNNVAKVNLNEWLELLKKCALKIGRNISNIEIITPEADFPSHDKNFPLKIAVCEV